jgi:voltage-gated potassium channel
MTTEPRAIEPPSLKRTLYRVIFESDTHAGRLFDRILIFIILISLLVVVLDSVQSISARYHSIFYVLEWGFTFIFTIEYIARLYCAHDRKKYALSFFGIIDLIAFLPSYLAFFFPEIHSLIDIRILRLLRVFRIFKLTSFLVEYTHLANALAASRRKIMVFLSVVLMVVFVMGTLMYVVEGPHHGFTNIPISVYWAITTMTTVGFGDITPQTDFGKLIASIMMLMGWGTLAVPTGIVTSEMTMRRYRPNHERRTCPNCLSDDLNSTDKYCRECGIELPADRLPS